MQCAKIPWISNIGSPDEARLVMVDIQSLRLHQLSSHCMTVRMLLRELRYFCICHFCKKIFFFSWVSNYYAEKLLSTCCHSIDWLEYGHHLWCLQRCSINIKINYFFSVRLLLIKSLLKYDISPTCQLFCIISIASCSLALWTNE